MLVAGGAGYAELYDARSGGFRVLAGEIGDVRLFLTASLLGRRRALLLGGYDQTITPTAQAWVFG